MKRKQRRAAKKTDNPAAVPPGTGKAVPAKPRTGDLLVDVKPKTIGLCMIVKNESRVILRCLESVRPLVDYVLIEDTGSTDNTQSIIREWLDRVGLPGEVYDEPWRNFAYNRSHALARLREKRDICYALIMDADDVLVSDEGFDARTFKKSLSKDVYKVRIRQDAVWYFRPLICSNRRKFLFRGVLHEFLDAAAPGWSSGDAAGFHVWYGSGGARSQDPDKYRKDAEVLEKALQSEEDPSLRSRYIFYLARSYRDAGEKDKALPYFLKRAELGYWADEVFMSLYSAAQLQKDLGTPYDEVLATYQRATEAAPHRAEALHAASRLSREKNNFAEGYEYARRGLAIPLPTDGLFLENWIYEYGLLDELAVSAYWIGKYAECADACDRLLSEGKLPAEMRERVRKNAEFAADRIRPQHKPIPPFPETPAKSKTIGLCMIVKNESRIILRCLESVRPLVDYVLIEDTGSTDNTQSIIREWLDRVGLPGEVYDEPWRNFAYNRSHALARLREKRDICYALIMDADDVLVPDEGFDARTFKKSLSKDVYKVRIRHDAVWYFRPLICSNRRKFLFRGVLHEFLDAAAPGWSSGDAAGFHVWYGSGGARSQDPDKYRKDAEVLEKALQSEEDPFLRSRYTFYLAKSYRDAGEKEKALVYFLKRAELGYWDDEVFVSLFYAARLQEEMGLPVGEVIETCLRASEAALHRAEALHAASRLSREKNNFAEGYEYARRGLAIPLPTDGLFLENWIYEYGLLDELAVSAYWIGKYAECADACDRLLSEGKLPAEMRERVLKNKQYAIDKLAETREQPTVTLSEQSNSSPKMPGILHNTTSLDANTEFEKGDGCMTTETLTLPPDTLGYAYNKGGLNNQKLALFGLFLRAFREGPRRLVLPDFIQFDQISFNHIPVPISHAFQLDELRTFAARHEIEIVDIPACGDQGGWDHFHYGNSYIPFAALSEQLSPECFPCDFFRSLIPTIKDSDLLRKVSDAAFGARDIGVVAQLRIERDWEFHNEHRLRPVVSNVEDNTPSFKDIIHKLRNTIGADETRVYVVCDEAALPVSKADIRESIRREFDIELFWKSDFLTQEEIQSLSLLSLSCLDFEMAIRANSFVGLTRSTFSNMVGLEKYARTGAPLERHYIYNIQGPRLALRADNGAFSVPALAMASDAKTSIHYFDLGEIFREAGEHQKALDSYLRCAAADEPDREEVFLSFYRAAQIKAELGFPAGEVIDTFSRATEVLPNRAEALHGAARFCRNTGLHERGYEFATKGLAIAYPKDARGAEGWIYEYGLLDELAVNAYWIARYQDCLDTCQRLLREGKMPQDMHDRVRKNAEFASEKIRTQNEPTPRLPETPAHPRSTWAPETPSAGTELMVADLRKRMGAELNRINLQVNHPGHDKNDERPRVVWMHHDVNQSWVQWCKDRELVDSVDCFVFVSYWQRERYLNAFPLPPERCFVLRHALDPGAGLRLWEGGSTWRCAYTSTPFRGLSVLLDAWQRLSPANAELHIWSSMKLYLLDDGPYEHLYKRAESMPGVIYHGIAPNHELRLALRDMHFLAYPCTFAETACLAVIEAMAAGCRVIVPSFGALPETTGGYARIYPWNPDQAAHALAFAEIMASELESPWAGDESLALAQQQHCAAVYDWPRRLEEWRQLIDTACSLAARTDLTH